MSKVRRSSNSKCDYPGIDRRRRSYRARRPAPYVQTFIRRRSARCVSRADRDTLVSMCLAVPMKIVELLSNSQAVAEQGASRIEIDTTLLATVDAGDYVIVHAGYAIEKLDTEDAEERIQMFEELTP